MPVLIDSPMWPHRGRLWCHLVSDVSYDELHAFAAQLGLPPQGFQGDHYDVPEHLYAPAVALGATPVSGRDLVRRLIGAGLKLPRHRPGPRGGGQQIDPPGQTS